MPLSSPLFRFLLCFHDLVSCFFGGVAFMPLALCVARWLRRDCPLYPPNRHYYDYAHKAPRYA